MATEPGDRRLPPPPESGGTTPADPRPDALRQPEASFENPYAVRTGKEAQLGWARRMSSGLALVAYLVALGALAALLVAAVVVIAGVLISGSLN